jgi:hypothetical protein
MATALPSIASSACMHAAGAANTRDRPGGRSPEGAISNGVNTYAVDSPNCPIPSGACLAPRARQDTLLHCQFTTVVDIEKEVRKPLCDVQALQGELGGRGPDTLLPICLGETVRCHGAAQVVVVWREPSSSIG